MLGVARIEGRRMVPGARRILVAAVPALLAAACSTTHQEPSPVVSLPSTTGIYKIGNPYQIEGTWYYPREQPDYDETGIASWYGPPFHGRHTANGEVYDSNALTAAHRTLPMPVNVRVTNLDNGKSLILRVNDRGPYARGRIIDVSARAAQLLGFQGAGTAKVRVTYISRAELPDGTMPSTTPAAIASALPALPAGQVVTAPLDPVAGIIAENAVPAAAPAPIVAPSPAPPDTEPTGQITEVPVPAVSHIYVQAGAFGIRANAERLKERLAAAGNLVISAIDRKGQPLYRVRIGPFGDVGAADAALAKLLGLGNSDAKIVVDQ
jgi:rare lipoprotein A